MILSGELDKEVLGSAMLRFAQLLGGILANSELIEVQMKSTAQGMNVNITLKPQKLNLVCPTAPAAKKGRPKSEKKKPEPKPDATEVKVE